MKYGSIPYKTLDGLLAAQAMRHHDHPFLRLGDECLTYGQVERQAANQCAAIGSRRRLQIDIGEFGTDKTIDRRDAGLCGNLRPLGRNQ